MSYAIQIDGLKKSYGDHAVLKGLQFDVRKGEILALLGVNGAGKTTALECIEGLRKTDGGRIRINGRMGIQLQSASLPSHIKPMEAVRLFAKWNKTRVDPAMLESLGIAELERTPYHNLSTGQKRRLHLALALVRDPDIVILDEPTAGLDVEGRLALHEQIRRLKAQGKTILLASHDMAEVESLCDRLVILRHGQAVFCGTAAELSAKTGKRYTVHVETEQGVDSAETDAVADTLLTWLEDYKRKGLTVLDIRIERGTLEEHFLDMARGDGT